MLSNQGDPQATKSGADGQYQDEPARGEEMPVRGAPEGPAELPGATVAEDRPGGADAPAPDEAGEALAGDGGAAEPVDVDALQARVTDLEARERELTDRYVKLLAEFDNYRRRTRQEMEALRATAAEALLSDLLPIVDSLDQAVSAAGDDAEGPLGQGVKLIRQQLADVLARHGVEPIEAVGRPFDPHTMQAVAQAEPTEAVPDGHVLEEYRRGYRLQQKLLRPSLVKVAQAP
ncbi:MAG: nucleotide exchange factor GrpE [Firmicutes bacterium]|nr:nucleotide exchange factor GrpE [Bacillota bacterium]